MVIHGGAGLDAHAEERVRQFTALGYATFACDMYGDGVAGNRERVMASIQRLRSDRDCLRRRAEAGMRTLAEHSSVPGRIAAVGYCFGGMVAMELARSGVALAAAVSVHGSLVTAQQANPGDIKTPILVCHGALDPHAPWPHVTSFVAEMNAASADWQFVIYGGALHGFTQQAAPAGMTGVAYDERADRRSLQAIDRFLREAFAA